MTSEERTEQAQGQGQDQAANAMPKRSRAIYRIALAITILTMLVVIAISTILILSEKNGYLNKTKEEGISLAQTVAAALANSIVRKDYAFVLDHSMLVLKARKTLRYIVVVRQDGQSLVHTPERWEKKQLADPVSKQMSAIKEPAFLKHKSVIAKEEVLESAVPISVSGLQVGVIRLGSSAKPFNEHMANVYVRTLVLALICLGFAVLGAILLARNITRPIERAEKLEQAYRDLNTAHQAIVVTQQELAHAYEKLEEHDRQKTLFFDNVSHELRTPLTLVLTPLERLLNEDLDQLPEQAKEKLRIMQGNAQRLLRLVNQLLDFSSAESGGATLGFEQRDVRELVQPIVDGFLPFARSKGIKLELRGAETLPPAYVDPEKLDKVICNLLSNACKFTDPGGSVVVRLGADAEAISISVKDTGHGIPEQDLHKIFERFQRLDDPAARQHEGTGIGLPLAKKLTEMSGGSLEVESELGFGSTFTVTLPLGKDHIPDPSMIRSEAMDDTGELRIRSAAAALAAEAGMRSASVSATEGEAAAEEEASGPESEEREVEVDDRPLVVVVEDNPDMRALVRDICAADFRVMEAADGEQGLKLIVERHPELVISDVMMPGIDGNELLRRVRADPETATTPVMLLTAKASPEKRLEGLESGADDYLSKPFESRELLARARNLVRLQQQERRLKELNAKLQQEVVSQAAALERARMLERFMPPEVARAVTEGDQPAQARQQRLRVTVFRIELRGFDQMVEVVEPEDMAAMLNSYLSEMVEVAFSHGATVDKFIRDTVIGFFGAPGSEGPEQDALRCGRMALELWQRAVEVCERWRELLESKPPVPTIVLASGFATVGSFGSSNRLEYTAVGGPVDDASGLIPSVSPGEVVCSQSTFSMIQGELPGKFCMEATVRHRSRKVKLFRIAGPPASLSQEVIASETGGTMRTPSREDALADTVPPSEAAPKSPTTPSGELAPGAVLSKRYQVIRRLGEGGMGTIYLANDIKLGTEVALKLLRHDQVANKRRISRLYREVKLARLVSHPNVARIYDLGDWEGYEFISMEYIHGQTLDFLLKTRGALSLIKGQNVLLQLCAGLSAAHAAGIVHRDLKPSNIMLEPEPGNRVVILDFGIARWVSSLQQTRTDTGGAIGTPHYMSPEQFETDQVDHRADIYALGVVAFEIFTGRRPFEADNPVILAVKHASEKPKDPLELNPELPPRLAAVILTCLEKSPQARFNSVGEISSCLLGAPPDSLDIQVQGAREKPEEDVPPPAE